MIRKIVIVVLTLAAAVTAVLAAVSTWTSVDPTLLFSGNGLEFADGKLAVHYRHTIDPGQVREWFHSSHGLGFEYRRQCIDRRGSPRHLVVTEMAVPAALVVIVLGVYPVWAFLRGPRRRWHRRRSGLCLECGYDLTGNVSGVCPECSTKIEQSPPQNVAKP
jgi:hypothetical protein